MKKVVEMLQRNREMLKRAVMVCMNVALMCSMTVCRVNANFQGIKSAADKSAEEVMWGGLLIVAVIAIASMIRRNFLQAGITILVGGGICVLAGNLDILVSLGNWVIENILGMSVG